MSKDQILAPWEAQYMTVAAFNKAKTAEELRVEYRACQAVGVQSLSSGGSTEPDHSSVDFNNEPFGGI